MKVFKNNRVVKNTKDLENSPVEVLKGVAEEKDFIENVMEFIKRILIKK